MPSCTFVRWQFTSEMLLQPKLRYEIISYFLLPFPPQLLHQYLYIILLLSLLLFSSSTSSIFLDFFLISFSLFHFFHEKNVYALSLFKSWRKNICNTLYFFPIQERVQMVYNWQYIHCLNFWGELLSKTHPSTILQPLIYPLIQVWRSFWVHSCHILRMVQIYCNEIMQFVYFLR